MKPIDEFIFKLYEVEKYTERQLIDCVCLWSKDKDWFDTTFIESLDKRISRGNRLTGKQFRSLVSVVVKNDIKPENILRC